ncbi:hypothetical protein F5Y18DRAFT_373194 [Xylariaceae sp. FL1019]|nr:hypothetical protein F5Y18DRAFT_373194 [Xylariaceae sp. FL1019]
MICIIRSQARDGMCLLRSRRDLPTYIHTVLNMSFLGFEKNISYYTVPIALVLALLPRNYSGLSGPGAKIFNRQQPRDFVAALKEADLDEKLRGRLLRAEACSANGFEAFPVYAAAVTAGNSAGVSATTMNLLSIGWVASRVLYNYVYIWYQEKETLAFGEVPMRFKVWSIGATICLSMFVLAGRNM